jgi:manganese transport protein
MQSKAFAPGLSDAASPDSASSGAPGDFHIARRQVLHHSHRSSMTPPPPHDSASLDAGAMPTCRLPASRHWLRRLLAFMGPGYLVAVGYMDPGNWATDLAAGSGYGYTLLWVVMLSSLMAILLQTLAVRLGVVTGMDLAQVCRANSSRRSAVAQWLACEVAICACDLAEVIGSAIALKLLFGLPLSWGVALTALDALLVLWLQGKGLRWLEAFIIALLTVIFCCFGAMLILAQPDWAAVAAGLTPGPSVLAEPELLYLATGIIGATVMPHNLYLHSSIVQHRAYVRDKTGKREALKYATADVVIALLFAFFVNAAILIVAGAVFHASGHTEVEGLQDAHRLLAPLLGGGVASFLFALALLASGQSSTLTATMAGQIVMEGFLHLKMPVWRRRLLTRSVAIVPALIAAIWFGENAVARLLVASQVILSLQLPFAVVPLVRYTSQRRIMGAFVNPRWLMAAAILVAALLIGLNLAMLVRML